MLLFIEMLQWILLFLFFPVKLVKYFILFCLVDGTGNSLFFTDFRFRAWTVAPRGGK